MKAHILRGSKQEIAEGVARLAGEVREAIVFIDEPSGGSAPPANVNDFFAEMEPYMVDVADVDDSREGIYSRMDGE